MEPSKNKNSILIDFSTILEEIEKNKIELCLIKNNIFIKEVNKNIFYIIELTYIGSYLDYLIEKKKKVCFEKINLSDYLIEFPNVEILSIEKVKKFIERSGIVK